VLDIHAPVRTRTVTLRPVNRWMTTEILDTKTKLRHFERCWRSRQLAIDFEIFQTHLLAYSEMLKAARTLFFSTEVRQCRGDMRALYCLVGDLMGSTTKPSLPTRSSDQEVADNLNQFSALRSLLSHRAFTPTLILLAPHRDQLPAPSSPLMDTTCSFSALSRFQATMLPNSSTLPKRRPAALILFPHNW
jgi:hypothetical protein